jgi:phenylacetate-CoA ligase
MDGFAWLVRRAVAPAWAAWERSPYLRHERRLRRTQFHAPERIRADQWQRIGILLRHAYHTTRFWKERLDAAGFTPERIRDWDDFRAIGLLTKADLRARGQDMRSELYCQAPVHHRKTSGSTGVSVELVVDDAAQQFHRACTLRADQWSGWRLGERVAMIWGNPEYLHRGWRGRLRNALLERATYLDTLKMDAAAIERFTRALLRRPPSLLFGHAHSLYLFAEFLRDREPGLIRPRGIISSAMVLHDWERRTIEDVFQCPVTNRYGCEEVGLIACQCERHAGLHVNADAIHVEVLRGDGTPAQPGEPGRVVVTDLVNRAMPIIRYQVGDMATVSAAGCSCGRGLPVLERVEGRIADYVVTPRGELISGISLTENFAVMVPGVAQLQIVQEEIDRFVFRIVRAAEFGVLEMLERVGQVLSICLLANGIRLAAFTFYCQAKDEPTRRKTAATVLYAPGVILLGSGLLAGGLAPYFGRLMGVSDPSLLVLGITAVMLEGLASVPLALVQARLESAFYVRVTVAMFCTRVLLTILAVAYVSCCAANLMDAIFWVPRRSGLKSWILAASATVTMALYAALIPPYGAMGAAYETLGGMMTHCAITFAVSQRMFRVHYEFARLSVMLVLALPLALAAGGLGSGLPQLAARLVLCAAFPLALWYGGILSREEKTMLLAMLPARLVPRRSPTRASPPASAEPCSQPPVACGASEENGHARAAEAVREPCDPAWANDLPAEPLSDEVRRVLPRLCSRIMATLFHSFREVQECAVPRPLLVLPECESYVMEYVAGGALSDAPCACWFTPRHEFQAVARRYALCGRWLKHFQRATGIRAAGVEALEPVVHDCRQLFDRIKRETGAPCPWDFQYPVMRLLAEQLARVRDGEVLLSGCHGDFGPRNVLATQDGVTVIDFPGYCERPLLLDGLAILVFLDDEACCLTSSRRRAAELRAWFLQGYGELPAAAEPVALACETFARLASVTKYLLAKPERLHHRLDRRRILAKHVAWLSGTRPRALLWPRVAGVQNGVPGQ